jgi:DNA polymerase I-like protein with 3'-5' exonuclease and polymerase domains
MKTLLLVFVIIFLSTSPLIELPIYDIEYDDDLVLIGYEDQLTRRDIRMLNFYYANYLLLIQSVNEEMIPKYDDLVDEYNLLVDDRNLIQQENVDLKIAYDQLEERFERAKMKTFNRLKHCNCDECPLSGNDVIKGSVESDVCKVAVIVSNPSFGDVKNRKVLSDNYGKYLNMAIGRANIRPHQVWRTSVIACRPPKEDMSTLDSEEALRCCRKGFLAELEYLKSIGVKVFVPLGNIPLQMMKIPFKITKIRGSVVQVSLYKVIGKKNRKIRLSSEDQPKNTSVIFKDFVVVPTYAPRFMIKGKQKEETTWVNDFKKVKEFTRKNFKAIEESFNLFPTVEEIEAFRDEVVKNKTLLACDIETTGLDPYYAGVYCIGFSTSDKQCIVIARLREGGGLQWVNGDVGRVKKAILDMLAKCPTAWQNALFDVPFLWQKGYKVLNVKHDTFLAHHCIHAELPHTLGYITSVYGKTSYWKDAFLNREGRITDMDEREVREYNARDCVVIHQVLPEMLDELKKDDTLKIYENIAIPLIKPVSEMIITGIKIDPKRLSKWKKELTNEVRELRETFTNLSRVPDYFNLGSTQHLCFILFGILPNGFKKTETEYLKYFKPESKLKRNTKKFAELEGKYKFFTETKSLRSYTQGRLAKTKGGNVSTAEDTINAYYIKIRKRVDKLKSLKRPNKEHYLELSELELTCLCVKTLMDFRKRNKMLTTYTTYKLNAKDRVCFKYKIHGTSTGRLSSGNKDEDPNDPGNGQNIPPEAKKIFVVDEGNVFVNADYSGLELAIIAYASNDTIILDMLAAGLNVHDENTKYFFGLKESDPKWKSYRSCMKQYIFGRNYGGSLPGMYKRVLTKDPSITVTFVTLDTAYFKKHTAYKKWYNTTKKLVETKRVLSNGFGRKRYFLGTNSQILREGLNFPIQSTAGDLMSLALIDVHRELRKQKYKTKLIGTVHDSMMLEVPKKELDTVLQLTKKHMTMPREVFGKERSFKVDFEVGPSWGELKKVEVI